MKPLRFLIAIVLIITVTLGFTPYNNHSGNVDPPKSIATARNQAIN